MKKIIRLTEGDLRGIIKRSVNKILREGAFDYVPSANDYEGIADDNFNLDNYDSFYDYDNLGDYEPVFDDYGIDTGTMTDIDPDNLSDEDLSVDFNESRGRIGRIIRESVNKVLKKKSLNEGIKGVDPNNVVPQSVAEKYGFKREYSGFENGLELWGKSINMSNIFSKRNKWGDKTDMSTRELLHALGISNFTSLTKTPYGLTVRITVEPDKTMENELGWGKRRRKIGDYEDTEWRDKDGAIFHNPKNGHFKRF